jgi:hypothetical protein
MNAQQFYTKVKQLREAQRRYFKDRNSRDLMKCREIERELDTEIERVEKLRVKNEPEPQQLRLFVKQH